MTVVPLRPDAADTKPVQNLMQASSTFDAQASSAKVRNYSNNGYRLLRHPDDWLNDQIIRMGGQGLRRCQIAELFDTSEGRLDSIIRRTGVAKSRDVLSAMAACPEFRDAVYLYTGGTLALSPAVSAAVENLARVLQAESVASDVTAQLQPTKEG